MGEIIEGLHVDFHGPEGAPPLLLMHGFMSSRAQWMLSVPRLGRRFRLAIPELLGHGRSEAPEEAGRYTAPAYHAAFEAIRERMGAERWFLCGQSFGAGLTLSYALAHPGRVIAQAFTNSGAAMRPDDDPRLVEEYRARARHLRATTVEDLTSERVHPANARRFPAEVKAEMLRDAARLVPEALALNVLHGLPGLAVLDRLEQVRTPTLLVNGRWEKRFQPNADKAEARMPDLRRVDLEGGHSINVEQAEAFDAALEGFVMEHAAASG